MHSLNLVFGVFRVDFFGCLVPLFLIALDYSTTAGFAMQRVANETFLVEDTASILPFDLMILALGSEAIVKRWESMVLSSL